MPNVRIKGVTKTYGPIAALRDVDLEVRDGEYLSIVGPSGCGKTTLIKSIAGIVQPDEGEVYLDEQPVTSVPAEDRGIGYVFQEFALFPHMTVRENVSYGPMVRGAPPEKFRGQIRELLDMMALADRSHSYPRELSGGARQKTAVARALAAGSGLLLLDEPLGALDRMVRMILRYELRAMVKDLGLTAIHITHDQEEALSISDRVAVMRRGRVVEAGAPMDLYLEPRNIFTAKFLGEANFMEGEVIDVSRGGLVVDVGGSRLRTGKPIGHVLKEGDACVLAIRPEFVNLAPRGRSLKTNELRGIVRSAAFKGDAVQYEVDTENGVTIAVRSPLQRRGAELQVGDEASAEVPKSHLLVYGHPEAGLEGELSLE